MTFCVLPYDRLQRNGPIEDPERFAKASTAIVMRVRARLIAFGASRPLRTKTSKSINSTIVVGYSVKGETGMATSTRPFKDRVYEQLARIGKAVASPQRLELLDLLSQGPRTVENLAQQAHLTVANTSRHLQVLRGARLIEAEKEGVFVRYHLADEAVADFFRSLRVLAASRLAELDQITRKFFKGSEALEPVDRKALLARARKGLVTVLDVRPTEEYRSGHCRLLPRSLLRARRSGCRTAAGARLSGGATGGRSGGLARSRSSRSCGRQSLLGGNAYGIPGALERLSWRLRSDDPLGVPPSPPAAPAPAPSALGDEPRPHVPQHGPRADYGGRSGVCDRRVRGRAGDGVTTLVHTSSVGSGGGHAAGTRLCHLPPACDVPRRAGAVATAPRASCRPRFRRDHGPALPPHRDLSLARLQDGGGCAPRRGAVGGGRL